MYRDFKQHCPGGAATTNDLRPAYAKLFPLGDPTKYAQMVFNRFDNDNDGIVSFGDLLAGLTCIVKGDVDQKLSWIFGQVSTKRNNCALDFFLFFSKNNLYSHLFIRLYDTNGDDLISRAEMLSIISSIYEMIQSDRSIKNAINKHVERLFEKMDLNGDGVISREEFFTSCKNVRVSYIHVLLYRLRTMRRS